MPGLLAVSVSLPGLSADSFSQVAAYKRSREYKVIFLYEPEANAIKKWNEHFEL